MANPPIPSWADAGYLLFLPLAFAGLVALHRVRVRAIPTALWADGFTTALSVAAISAAIVFAAVLRGDSGAPLSFATALAYPLADMVLLAAVLGAVASMGWHLDRTWILLALGIFAFWLADSLYLTQTAAGTYQEGSWFDVAWWAGFFLLAVAAWQPPSACPRRTVNERGRLSVMPLAFGCLGLAVLVYGCLVPTNVLAVAFAAASLLGVMARLMITLRQNLAMLRATRGEALTDALTGLGNRRALTRELELRLAEIDPSRPQVLALFDLNGFKQYNDTFGHQAGDAVLVRLGGRLAASLGRHGRAFRMGGDEFCVVFDPGDSPADALVEGAAAALTEHGESFTLGCSYGMVELPKEASDVSAALTAADHACTRGNMRDEARAAFRPRTRCCAC
jgi:two-component system, cell cycle response regulator